MVNSNLSSLTRSLHCSMDGLNVSLGKNFFFVCITALSSLVNCWYCDCKFYKIPRANIKALSCLCISHPHVNLHPMRKETMSIIFSVRKKFSINIKRMNHIPEIQLHYLNNHKMFIPIFHAFENDIVTSSYFKNLWLLEEKIYFIQKWIISPIYSFTHQIFVNFLIYATHCSMFWG